MPLVTCEQDPEVEAEFPANMSGKVTVTARGGQVFARKVVVPKGEPANFLTEAELRAKFHGLADAVLGAGRAAQLADAVLGLDRAPDLAGLLRLGAPMLSARLVGE
jgi:2-methylcitrate dehydratase PrpD